MGSIPSLLVKSLGKGQSCTEIFAQLKPVPDTAGQLEPKTHVEDYWSANVATTGRPKLLFLCVTSKNDPLLTTYRCQKPVAVVAHQILSQTDTLSGPSTSGSLHVAGPSSRSHGTGSYSATYSFATASSCFGSSIIFATYDGS